MSPVQESPLFLLSSGPLFGYLSSFLVSTFSFQRLSWCIKYFFTCWVVPSVFSIICPDVPISLLPVLVSCLFSLLSVLASPLVLYLFLCLVCSLCCQSRRPNWSIICSGVLSVLSISPGVAISLLWCSDVLSVLSAISPGVAIGLLCVLVSCLFCRLSVQASPLVYYVFWCLVCSLCYQSWHRHWPITCPGVLSVLSAVSPGVAIGPLSVLVSCLFSLLSVQASPLVDYDVLVSCLFSLLSVQASPLVYYDVLVSCLFSLLSVPAPQ